MGVDLDKQYFEAHFLSENRYDDLKFYLGNIEPQEIIIALKRIRSDAVGVDRMSIKLILKALPIILPVVIVHILTLV